MTRFRRVLSTLPIAAAALAAGCAHGRMSSYGSSDCDSCEPGGRGSGCCLAGGCGSGGCGTGGCCQQVGGWLFRRRTFAIPDTLPLGSTVRAHYHTMETNAEASDFILHRYEFIDNTAELTPAGRDHVVEIAARAKQAPFPVLVERSENNSDPELDAWRRNLIAQVLTDFGVPEANQRTVVSPAYGRHANSLEAEVDYHQTIYSRGTGGFGNGAGFGGGAGGFGGGGGGGGGGFGF